MRQAPLGNNFYKCSVVSYDNVRVREGKFKAFYVMCHGEARSSSYLSQNQVSTWFYRASLRVVSSEWKFSS